jgi:hypothetical protein
MVAADFSTTSITVKHHESFDLTPQRERIMQDRLTQEPGLSQSAATAMNTVGRADLAKADFDNAAAAIGQVLFAYDSGSPPQKSFLYKML